MENRMTFREKLIILRKNKGLTQDDFAKAVGVSRQAVYKWENGTSYPEIPKLLEIKALLEISLDDLFDDSFEVAIPEKKKRRARKPAAAKEAAVKEEITTPEATVEAASEVAPVAEAPVEEKAPETPAPKAETEEKKVGFFGRLFGRR
jgi:transcriptional regulator with XRE-family HTH domain